MFPFVDGFHWSFGHIFFVSVFFAVLTIIGITLILSFRRSVQAAKSGQADAIRWKSEFHDLAECDRQCRHELAGRVEHRLCHNEFDCRKCDTHPKLVNAIAAEGFDVGAYGLSYPADRLYHRGQTWVRSEDDGTLTVGLTDLGRRLLGRADSVDLPRAGEHLHANGRAWTMTRNGAVVRLRSPVDGEVVETGGPDKEYYLRLKPAVSQPDLAHLLRGAEVSGWVRSQLDRLQILATPAGAAASLADGGVLMDDLPKAQPDADWDKVYSELFLEP